MVEYGNGVRGVAGQVSGGSGSVGSNGTMDVGVQATRFFNDAVHTVSTMPPLEIALIVALVILGLVLLRRAF